MQSSIVYRKVLYKRSFLEEQENARLPIPAVLPLYSVPSKFGGINYM